MLNRKQKHENVAWIKCKHTVRFNQRETLKPELQVYAHSPPASCRAPWLLRRTWPAPEGWRVGRRRQRSLPPAEVYLETQRTTERNLPWISTVVYTANKANGHYTGCVIPITKHVLLRKDEKPYLCQGTPLHPASWFPSHGPEREKKKSTGRKP